MERSREAWRPATPPRGRNFAGVDAIARNFGSVPKLSAANSPMQGQTYD